MIGAAIHSQSDMAPIFRTQCWMDGMEEPQLLVNRAVGITATAVDGLPPDSCYTPFCQPLPQLRPGETMEFLSNCLASECASFQFEGNTHVKAFEGSSSSAAES